VAERREDLRAADVDRQFVADRLKTAVDEGRLSLSEYDERLQTVYAAKTYGDLDQVLADLPGFTPVSHSQLTPAAPTSPATVAVDNRYPTDAVRQEMQGHPVRSMPKWLLGIWSTWLAAVGICVVIWALTSVSSNHWQYFWPMWVAGPWGALLLAATFSGMVNGDHQREVERRAVRREQRRRDRRDRRG
jgi:hypothetical protein